MNDISLLILVLIAIFIGWLLGRHSARKVTPAEKTRQGLSEEYIKGLDFLINEQSDKVIDVFIQSLEVNQDTFDTHLALGKMFCRRGEVDRAILIHKNLLDTSGLDEKQQFIVLLELANDYLAAGLLDRSEEIYSNLLDQSGYRKQECLKNLLQIYEREKDWEKAIKTANKLFDVGDKNARQLTSHYYCELAQLALAQNKTEEARCGIKSALQYDTNSVRASLLEGQLEFHNENYTQAIEALKRIKIQDPDYISESVEPLRKCCDKAGNEKDLINYLASCLQQYPAVTVVLALADIVGSSEGDTAAASIIANYLKQAPSIRGLNRLIDFHIAHSSGKAKENLSILRDLTENLIAHKPVYNCHNCGYSSKVLHWLCPSCRQWGTVKPIHGLEGE